MIDDLLARIAMTAIRIYQRRLSPLKGFRCAYAVHCGRPSCSAQALRGFQRAGFLRGLRLLRRQFDRCVLAAAALRETPSVASRQPSQRRPRPWPGSRARLQAGDCDCAVPDLALPDCVGVEGACGSTPAEEICGVLSCLDCDCDPDLADRGDRRRRCCSSNREARVQAARRRAEQRTLRRGGRRNDTIVSPPPDGRRRD